MAKRKNIARDGAPKKLATAPAHSGMAHIVAGEGRYSGLSRTQSAKARPFDASSPSPTDPSLIGKRIAPAPVKPGMRSRVAGPDKAARLPSACKEEC